MSEMTWTREGWALLKTPSFVDFDFSGVRRGAFQQHRQITRGNVSTTPNRIEEMAKGCLQRRDDAAGALNNHDV